MNEYLILEKFYKEMFKILSELKELKETEWYELKMQFQKQKDGEFNFTSIDLSKMIREIRYE